MIAQDADWIDLLRPDTSEAAEIAESDLFEMGAMGLEERDGNPPVLRAWFATGFDRARLSRFTVVGDGHVEAQDWDQSWRLQQEPIRVTKNLWVVPPWVAPPENAGTVLKMETKQAFGTGGHESTRLACALLEELSCPGKTVFDLGAGTGILGFYARILGADAVTFCDIDPEAMECLKENAEMNGIDGWRGWTGSIEGLGSEQYDLVLANMLRSDFFPLREATMPHLAPGGALVLAGYLFRERPIVTSWLAEEGLAIEAERREGEWWACAARKPA